MNAKKCKLARRIACQAASQLNPPGLLRRLVYEDGKNGTIINDPQSARGIYRQLKKQYKQAYRH